MINIVKQGVGWSVLRDGLLIREGGRSGVHETKGSAYRYAKEMQQQGETIQVEGGTEDIRD